MRWLADTSAIEIMVYRRCWNVTLRSLKWAGDMAQWLRVLAVLTENQSSDSSIYSRCSQPPVTLALRNPMFSGLIWHMGTYVHTHTHTHTHTHAQNQITVNINSMSMTIFQSWCVKLRHFHVKNRFHWLPTFISRCMKESLSQLRTLSSIQSRLKEVFQVKAGSMVQQRNRVITYDEYVAINVCIQVFAFIPNFIQFCWHFNIYPKELKVCFT